METVNIECDITKDKSGKRHSKINLELELPDLEFLHNAYIASLKNKILKLETDLYNEQQDKIELSAYAKSLESNLVNSYIEEGNQNLNMEILRGNPEVDDCDIDFLIGQAYFEQETKFSPRKAIEKIVSLSTEFYDVFREIGPKVIDVKLPGISNSWAADCWNLNMGRFIDFLKGENAYGIIREHLLSENLTLAKMFKLLFQHFIHVEGEVLD